jgi:hypothetical protein
MAGARVSTETLRRFSEVARSADDEEPLVDEQTWNDLDMDAVHARIDRTVSPPGHMVLYRMLRSAAPSKERLSERDALIGVLTPPGETGDVLRSELARLERTAGAEDLMSLLWEDPPEGLSHPWVVRLLAMVAIGSVPLALTVGGAAAFAPVLAFALNAIVHFRTRLLWLREIQALRFVGAVRACARRVIALSEPLLEHHQRRLETALRETAPIARRVRLLSSGTFKDVLYDYVSIFLLLELQSYEWLVRRWPEESPALRQLFTTLGELDALAGVARWRIDLPTWCRPELEGGHPHLEIVQGAHPLLDEPVPVSLSLASRGCLVTGSNMSGKSTLLRTLGITTLLAQTIFTCPARRYRASWLRIVSSMRVGDNILEGKSRYLAEAERLLALVRDADHGPSTLCLIDELLSGTNVTERLAASRAILDYLARHGVLVVAATHDIELTESLRGRYDSYFFADELERDDMRFDYRLRPGVATTRNAVRLLERLGYPEAIVAQARQSRG